MRENFKKCKKLAIFFVKIDFKAQKKVCVKKKVMRENFQKMPKNPFHALLSFSRRKKNTDHVYHCTNDLYFYKLYLNTLQHCYKNFVKLPILYRVFLFAVEDF